MVAKECSVKEGEQIDYDGNRSIGIFVVSAVFKIFCKRGELSFSKYSLSPRT